MFFVHPQIKFNKKNFKSIFFSFFKSTDFEILKKKLSEYFPEKQFVFTDMGRTAFKIIVDKFNLRNCQILMPSYICDIFFPILKQYSITPVFLDIDLKSFNINLDLIQKKITSNTKAILISHTYGLPLDVEKIKEITGNHLLIIEDCAHSFFTGTGNKGDVAFFSLYKQFPTLRGGLLVCSKEWKVLLPKTNFSFRDFISFLNSFSPFAFLFKRFGQEIAPKMIKREKMLEPTEINPVSLNLFSNFLEDSRQSLEKRKNLALFFQEELKKMGFEVQESKNNVFCYLSALVPKDLEENRDEIVKKLRKYGIFCTRIWREPIVFNPEVQKEYGIKLEEFPNTIEAAKRIINFPLQNYYQKKEEIEEIIEGVKKTLDTMS